jgi:multimeric flavodoxin WrbA
MVEGDGYVFVTPEYNFGYPAVLKNAFDHIYHEWNNKPVAFISYGGAAGGQSSGPATPAGCCRASDGPYSCGHRVSLLPGGCLMRMARSRTSPMTSVPTPSLTSFCGGRESLLLSRLGVRLHYSVVNLELPVASTPKKRGAGHRVWNRRC